MCSIQIESNSFGNSLEVRTQLIRGSKRERLEQEGSKIFIDEHLTRTNADILTKAKKLVKKGVIWLAWFRNGKVWVREEENGPNTTIKAIEESPEIPNTPDIGHPSKSESQRRDNKVEKTGASRPQKALNVGTPGQGKWPRANGGNKRTENKRKKPNGRQGTLEQYVQRFTRSSTQQYRSLGN